MLVTTILLVLKNYVAVNKIFNLSTCYAPDASCYARLQAASCSWVVCFSIHPFFHCQTCEHDILKANEQISMQTGTSGLWGKGMKDQLLVSGGPR